MKKFALIFALFACSLATAQTPGIFIDKTEADGSRYIASESINCRNGMSDRHPMMFAVARFSSEDRVAWSLNIDFPSGIKFKIPKGSVLLIKLSDDNVIELKQTLPTDSTMDVIGVYNDMAGIRTYTMHGSYVITEEQIEQIANKGVKKIRVETEIDHFDTDYKKNKVGEAVAKGYRAVKSAASQSSDLKANF